MATVERRRQQKADGSPGEVRYRVRWRDPDGKQRSRTFPKRKLADQWATEVEHKMLAGSYIDPVAGRITLQAYAEEWRKARVWSPSTAERVEIVFRLHLYPALGGKPIGSIRPSHVQAWVAHLSTTLAPSTVGVMVTHFSGVMRSAVRDRLIPVNPCTGVDLPRVPRTEVVPPTPEQVELLIGHAAELWRAPFIVGAGLGLRVSEALGLTVSRVDFLRQSVRVDRQATIEGGTVRLKPMLKTEASYRTVPLADVVAKALARHIETFGPGPDGVIFHRDGRMLRRTRTGDALRSAMKKANDPVIEANKRRRQPEPLPFPAPVRFHDLRHFYASMLIAGGASVKTVQKRLGHAGAVETLDTYGHLWPDSEEQTKATVEAVLAARVAYL